MEERYFTDLSTLPAGGAALWEPAWSTGPRWLVFDEPEQILSGNSREDLKQILDLVDAWRLSGFHAVGYLSYEAASLISSVFSVYEQGEVPPVWFALYREPHYVSCELKPEEFLDLSLTPDWNQTEYNHSFLKVKDALQCGRSYQVNLTFRLKGLTSQPGHQIFAARCGVEPPKYATYINGGDWQVLSFSPELFFERVCDRVTMRPMKGTQPHSSNAHAMQLDPKSIAENVMIVDMVRNDLGSVCKNKSINTTSLLEVERHRGLAQMTSTVTGRADCSLYHLFGATFPPASVTGAPKIEACKIVRELEGSPRGVYCGAIGYVSPEQERFSVGIRTGFLSSGKLEFGVGSGLVWDSEPGSEYEECLMKAERISSAGKSWRLIETMSSRRDLLELHIERLKSSADALGIAIDTSEIRHQLESFITKDEIIRLTVDSCGNTSIESRSSAIRSEAIQAVLATHPICSKDIRLRFKTTSREIYETALDQNYPNEVLFWNENGNLTEFCRGNLVVVLDGRLYTPPVEDGCLPGVFVTSLVRERKCEIRSLDKADLKDAEEIYFANSVVGLRRVTFQNAPRFESHIS